MEQKKFRYYYEIYFINEKQNFYEIITQLLKDNFTFDGKNGVRSTCSFCLHVDYHWL